jgi:hypothetical protein
MIVYLSTISPGLDLESLLPIYDLQLAIYLSFSVKTSLYKLLLYRRTSANLVSRTNLLVAAELCEIITKLEQSKLLQTTALSSNICCQIPDLSIFSKIYSLKFCSRFELFKSSYGSSTYVQNMRAMQTITLFRWIAGRYARAIPKSICTF